MGHVAFRTNIILLQKLSVILRRNVIIDCLWRLRTDTRCQEILKGLPTVLGKVVVMSNGLKTRRKCTYNITN